MLAIVVLLVQRLLPRGLPSAPVLLFTNKNQTDHPDRWLERRKWYFMPSHDFGGYADEYDPIVRELNRGRR